jgi:putative ABC transport system ATP-binding protein
VSEPVVLLADEPTGNLDSARSHGIMSLLKVLNEERGITILMVTHEPEMASYAQEVVHFLDGHISGREATRPSERS